ncbi:thioredoxin H1-like [Canna indica]|uniref:Thioredoxin H1-like n=1 Tax=Canna indica TaxID=4628 RepID=A0AAQ3JVK4_9LILI|nr:thioredoxin H1-like [Canna indica]
MAEGGMVIGCHSLSEWNRQIQLANESKKLVVIDFTATWCGPCRMIAPFLAELAKKFPSVIFLKVDVNELKRVAMDCEIEALPTILYVKDGTIIDRTVGSRKDELPRKIVFHMPK